MAGTTVDIKTRKGSGLTGYRALPEAGKAPGILLIQEIFGVNSHIKRVSDLYAEAGFVVLAPDVFWRVRPHVQLAYTPEGIQEGIDIFQKCDAAQLIEDLQDAIEALKAEAQCSGKVAAVGYCLGGYLSYRMAAENAVDAAVCYYGGRIESSLELAAKIHCPVMMHYGEQDAHIPLSAVEEVRRAMAARAEIFVYQGADHGFNCDERASYDRHSAMLAFGRSLCFLNKALA